MVSKIWQIFYFIFYFGAKYPFNIIDTCLQICIPLVCIISDKRELQLGNHGNKWPFSVHPGQDFWLHRAPDALSSMWNGFNESVWWYSAGGEQLWRRHVQLWIQPSDFKAIWRGAHENRGDKASTGIWPLSALRVNGLCSPNLLSRCVA